jgi:hypothetical protein
VQPLNVDTDETLDFVLPALHDAFGYSCRIASVPYVQASTVLALTGDDDSQVVPLPFPFRFYGTPRQKISIATNGFLTFASRDDSYVNDSIPSAELPNGAIYGYWDDLIIDNQSSVRTQLVGTAPNRRFVIEWRNATYYQDNTRRVTFEIVLNERTGIVSVLYRNIAPDDREQGSSATLGIENEAGSDALQYSFNKPLLGSPTFGITYLPPH